MGDGNVRIIESWRTSRATSMGSNGRTKCGGGIGHGKIGFFRLILLDTPRILIRTFIENKKESYETRNFLQTEIFGIRISTIIFQFPKKKKHHKNNRFTKSHKILKNFNYACKK